MRYKKKRDCVVKLHVHVFISKEINIVSTEEPAMTTTGIFNSLAPGKCSCNLKLAFFKIISTIDVFSISCEIVLGWMPQDPSDDKPTLGQQAITRENVDPDLYHHVTYLGHSEIRFKIQKFSFMKMHLNESCVEWLPFCLCLNVLRVSCWWIPLLLLYVYVNTRPTY